MISELVDMLVLSASLDNYIMISSCVDTHIHSSCKELFQAVKSQEVAQIG